MAPLLACGTRVAVITADLSSVARIASLFGGLAFPAQDVIDLISIHECCNGKRPVEFGGDACSECSGWDLLWLPYAAKTYYLSIGARRPDVSATRHRHAYNAQPVHPLVLLFVN